MFGGKMRILGIDPGLTRCGVGIVDLNVNRRASFVSVHVIRTPSTNELPARLFELESGLTELFDAFKPDAVAIERVFSQHNVRTAMGTAQASAVAMLIAARNQLDVAMYTPTEVKAAVTGYGRADKTQITSMVTRLLNLPEPPKPADAADALALALCHAWKGHGKSRIAEHLAKQHVVSV
jgi:crossover junction endodeoxyribonuclease RuvC